MDLITRAEFARRRGVSRAAVTQAVKAGRIKLVGDKVDAIQAAADWENNTDAAQSERANADKGPAALPAGGQPTAPTGGEGARSKHADPRTEFQEARIRRELAEAEMAELKLAEQRETLVSREGVERASKATARLLRDMILSVPPKVATELGAMTDPRQIETRLREELRRTLDELSRLARSGTDQAPN